MHPARLSFCTLCIAFDALHRIHNNANMFHKCFRIENNNKYPFVNQSICETAPASSATNFLLVVFSTSSSSFFSFAQLDLRNHWFELIWLNWIESNRIELIFLFPYTNILLFAAATNSTKNGWSTKAMKKNRQISQIQTTYSVNAIATIWIDECWNKSYCTE